MGISRNFFLFSCKIIDTEVSEVRRQWESSRVVTTFKFQEQSNASGVLLYLLLYQHVILIFLPEYWWWGCCSGLDLSGMIVFASPLTVRLRPGLGAPEGCLLNPWRLKLDPRQIEIKSKSRPNLRSNPNPKQNQDQILENQIQIRFNLGLETLKHLWWKLNPRS